MLCCFCQRQMTEVIGVRTMARKGGAKKKVNNIMMIIMIESGVKCPLSQLYRDRSTLSLLPKANVLTYGGENDSKERWSNRHLGESNPAPPC